MTEQQVNATLAPAAAAAAPVAGAARPAATAPGAAGGAAAPAVTPAAPAPTSGGSRRLPKTASPLPLVGLLGGALLALGAGLTIRRRALR